MIPGAGPVSLLGMATRVSHWFSGALRIFPCWVANGTLGQPVLDGIDYRFILSHEVGHVLVPDPGRQRVDGNQVRIELVEVDRIVAVDSIVGRQERDVSAARIDQPRC
jgi:hypothetical protein